MVANKLLSTGFTTIILRAIAFFSIPHYVRTVAVRAIKFWWCSAKNDVGQT
jgi:hypothetical protein